MKVLKYIFILFSLLLFSCENSVTNDNLDEFLESKSSKIELFKSRGGIAGIASRRKSKDKFIIENSNNELSVTYLAQSFYTDSIYKFELKDTEIDSLIIILKEAVNTHNPKKEYYGCCICSNLDFYLKSDAISMEVKPSEETEYLFYDLIEKYNSVLSQYKETEEYEGVSSLNWSLSDSNHTEPKEFKNDFVNLFNDDLFPYNDILSIINDTINFSFDFNLHSYDCGAPDCYSTFVDFSIPFSDSIVFPKTLLIKEYNAGSCFEAKAPKYYTFYLAYKSDNYLIFNSRGARKSLVLNRNSEGFNNKAYYFSTINYPITLKSVEGLLQFDENTKESEMPFTSTKLAYPI